MPAYNWPGQSGRTQGRTKDWPLRMAGAVTFYDAELSASLEAVGLSQVSWMLRQLTGQISAHYFSFNDNEYSLTSFS